MCWIIISFTSILDNIHQQMCVSYRMHAALLVYVFTYVGYLYGENCNQCHRMLLDVKLCYYSYLFVQDS